MSAPTLTYDGYVESHVRRLEALRRAPDAEGLRERKSGLPKPPCSKTTIPRWASLRRRRNVRLQGIANRRRTGKPPNAASGVPTGLVRVQRVRSWYISSRGNPIDEAAGMSYQLDVS